MVELVNDRKLLCEFLSKRVPSVPFPHGNEMKEFHAEARLYLRRRLKETAWNVLFYIGVAFVLVLGYFYW
jgi:hypothetical protein